MNWTEKAPHSKQNSTRCQSQSNGKESCRKQSECYYCGATPSHPKEKCRAFLLTYKCRKCGKEGHIARKCLSKPQDVNALDDSVSDDGQETYHVYSGHSFCEIGICTDGEKVFRSDQIIRSKKIFYLENFAIR